jgi:hypothetical protein
MNCKLRELVRQQLGQDAEPTAAADSQLVKTAEKREPVSCGGLPPASRGDNWRGRSMAIAI